MSTQHAAAPPHKATPTPQGWLQGAFEVDLHASRLYIISKHARRDAHPAKAHINALYPATQGRFLAATSWGLLSSEDQGRSWTPCAGDALALDPLVVLHTPRQLLAFSPSGLHASQDAGRSWEPLSRSRHDAPPWARAEDAAIQDEHLAFIAGGDLWWADLARPHLPKHIAWTRKPYITSILPLPRGFLLGTRSGALLHVPAPDDVQAVGQLPGPVEALASWRGHTLALTRGCLWTLHPHRDPALLPTPWLGHQARLLVARDTALLYNHQDAWIGDDANWWRVEGFPHKTSHVALQAGTLLTTDQKHIHTLQLADLLRCGTLHRATHP